MSQDQEVLRWLSIMQRFCAYQERSSFEVRKKLSLKKASSSQIEYIIQELQQGNYLNDTRFAHAYVEGKSNIKRWGKSKIIAGLRSHQISSSVIEKAIAGLTKEQTKAHLLKWHQKKSAALSSEANGPKKQAKIIRFLQSKGFNLDEILSVVNPTE